MPIPQTMINPENTPAYTETTNSALRLATKSPVEAGAAWLVENYPRVTAAHITTAGTLACLASAVVAQWQPETARKASWINLAGNLADAVDGSVARAQAKRRGEATTAAGALYDTINDRIQEYAAASSQSAIASGRGDKLGSNLLRAFAITSVLPSLARSHAESKGVVVSEGFIGNRHTRVTLNCLGYFWNQHPRRVQLMAAAGTALNLYNTGRRLQALNPDSPYNKGQLEPNKQSAAKGRRSALVIFAAATIVHQKISRQNQV